MSGNTVPTKIIDKNGKQTTVYKNPNKAMGSESSSRVAGVSSPSAASSVSNNSSGTPQRGKEFIPAKSGAVQCKKSDYGWSFFFYNDPATELGEDVLDDYIEIDAKGYKSLVKEVDFYIQNTREFIERTINSGGTSKKYKIEKLRAERDLIHLEALKEQIGTEEGLKQIERHGKAVSKAIDALYDSDIQAYDDFGHGIVEKVFDYGNYIRQSEPEVNGEDFARSLWEVMKDNEPSIVDNSVPHNELGLMYKIIQPILSKA